MLIYNDDNRYILDMLIKKRYKVDFIYGDCIYEEEDLTWAILATEVLKESGVLIVQTDYHTVADYKFVLDKCLGKENFINWCIYVNEWGGTPRRAFPRKHDDILIYSKSDKYKFYSDRIQIPKITAGTAFDKKGTGLKTPCDVFYDKVSFSTVARERIKLEDGHNIQWQKPLWLMERLLLPFTDEGDIVLDLFMGSGTLGAVCKHYNRKYIAVELDTMIHSVALDRLSKM